MYLAAVLAHRANFEAMIMENPFGLADPPPDGGPSNLDVCSATVSSKMDVYKTCLKLCPSWLNFDIRRPRYYLLFISMSMLGIMTAQQCDSWWADI
jgi:hypothetical protein